MIRSFTEKEPLRVIAIDAGVANIGVAIMRAYIISPIISDPPRWDIMDLLLLQTEADPRKHRIRAADSDIERVKEAMRQLDGLIEQYEIRRMAVELPVAGGQSAAALKYMALASAIPAHCEVRFNMMTEWYSPGECKKAVAGRWTSSKDAVAKVLEAKYPIVLEMFPTWEKREHVVDALACFETALRVGNVCRP